MDLGFLLGNWKLAFSIIPGLILFLYGIEHFSAEIQRVAGERFRALLGKLTKNRFNGFFLGTLVTAVIQSSTATTVIVVGLVNAGTISFAQSLGVIFGANVGTTVTAQLVAFKLTAFAPIFILLGFLLGLTGGRYKFLGKPVFYFGLVFFSLNLISDAMAPIKSDPSVASLFASFSSVPVAILAGFIFTVVVQSSSVTSGIVVLLADGGLVTLPQAIPLLLGAAIGTTTTAIIASLRMSLHAKRAAAAHFLFNLAGVMLMMPFIKPFGNFVSSLGGTAAQQVANAHTIFRMIFAVVFLAALTPFRRLVERVVSGTEEEILFKTKHLADELPEDGEEFLRQVEGELHHMTGVTKRLFDESVRLLDEPKSGGGQLIPKLGALSDHLDGRVKSSIIDFSGRKLSEREAARTVLLVRISNVLERMGDAGEDFATTLQAAREKRAPPSPKSVQDVKQVYVKFRENLELLDSAFPVMSLKNANKLKRNDRALRELINGKYVEHFTRLQKKEVDASFIELITLVDAANAKIGEVRKLSALYAKEV